jgi:hypothetical protein
MRINSLPLLLAAFNIGLAATAAADAVLDWNATHLQAIRTASTNPPRASRQMAMVNLAMYDAINGLNRSYWPYAITQTGPAGASKEAAASAAAKTVLDSLYSGNATVLAIINTQFTASLLAIPDTQAKPDGVNWGVQVGNAILDLRANDGWDVVLPYTPGTQPGQWRPTPPANAAALLPNWGNVTTFGIIKSSVFTSQPPPKLETSLYATEFNQVKDLGSLNSTTRTANETEIARFWSDGGGTETPPGHWMHIASNVSQARALTIDENARLFALLGMAVADSGIACWDEKYRFNYWRPITAIREADTDGNAATSQDAAWTPLITTPPFPECTSGHSTFSRASAAILAQFLGTDSVAFSTTSDGLAGVTRNYSSFSAAADEAGASRVYGGIHFTTACVAGQMCGQMIASFISERFLRPLNALEFALVGRSAAGTDLVIEVTAGKTYKIEASSDFTSWEQLATIVAGTSQIHFTDPNAPAGKRFYRASEQP